MAGVETASLLILLSRSGIQPHKAVITQDDGGAAREVMEMCFLSFDERWRNLDEHSLAKL